MSVRWNRCIISWPTLAPRSKHRGHQECEPGKAYEVSQEKKEDIIYLKNKAEELKAVMEINKKMTENAAKKPVVQSWFEYK